MPVMTGPQDPAAAVPGRLRAAHADREQVIEALKNGFVHGRLTKDELDTRAGQALAARTYAELAALTADIPPDPAAAGPVRPPAPARRRPLARAAAQSGSCLIIAAAAIWAAGVAGPDGSGLNRLCALVAYFAVVAAIGFSWCGVYTAWDQRRSRKELPPSPGLDGHVLDGERRSGKDPASAGSHTDRTRADLRLHKSRWRQRRILARAGRSPGGVRQAQGAA